ncbi:MAG: sigma-70 family RNA polymerase sigma factor, partial [Marinirhabdus sp.]|nr:sigma-70 family RNA polymerase sigma factor [Marinirhabdus sp.]
MPSKLFENVCSESVFHKLFQKLSKDLHDFIYYKYGAHFNPEDKVQDAFLTLWKNCEDVPPEKAKSYLFTIANNLSLNEAKHLKVVRNYEKQPVKSSTHITPEFKMQ